MEEKLSIRNWYLIPSTSWYFTYLYGKINDSFTDRPWIFFCIY